MVPTSWLSRIPPTTVDSWGPCFDVCCRVPLYTGVHRSFIISKSQKNRFVDLTEALSQNQSMDSWHTHGCSSTKTAPVFFEGLVTLAMCSTVLSDQADYLQYGLEARVCIVVGRYLHRWVSRYSLLIHCRHPLEAQMRKPEFRLIRKHHVYNRTAIIRVIETRSLVFLEVKVGRDNT